MLIKSNSFNDSSDSDTDNPDQEEEKETTAAMEPTTPSKTNKTLPASPHKTPRIPLSPWKPEHKEFWDPEVNFAWIDKHSPAKPTPKQHLAPRPDLLPPPTTSAAASDAADGPVKGKGKGKGKKAAAAVAAAAANGGSPTKKQLREAKKAFDETKDALARSFLAELDERVTGGRLGRLTAATGGLRTAWSNTLQTTAGRAHWRCRTVTRTVRRADGTLATEEEPQQQQQQERDGETGGGGGGPRHEAHIELAAKVLTNEADLLNTVAHEFCHLAVFMLDHHPHDPQRRGKKPAAHGAEFKAWGRRCGAAFAHRGIEVTTRHSYDIDYKFAWRCAACAAEVRRHSRSVDPRRHRCGHCRGALLQVKPVPRGGPDPSSLPLLPLPSPREEEEEEEKKRRRRQPSAWQEFVASEMRELGASRRGLSLEKKMEIISGRWRAVRENAGGNKDKDNGSGNDNGNGNGVVEDGRKRGGGGGDDDDAASRAITEGVGTLEIEDVVVVIDSDSDDDDDNDDVVFLSSSA